MADHSTPHPRCSECNVPMWIAHIDFIGGEAHTRYECKACDVKLVYAAIRERGGSAA
jgi:hypothetical protein